MSKVFVIVSCEGEYSDKSFNTLAVCKSSEKAGQLIDDLNRLSKWKNQQRKALDIKVQKYRAKLQAEYNIPEYPVKPEFKKHPEYQTNLRKWEKEVILPFQNSLKEWNDKYLPLSLELREKVSAFEKEEIENFLNHIAASDKEIILKFIPNVYYQDPYFTLEEVDFVDE